MIEKIFGVLVALALGSAGMPAAAAILPGEWFASAGLGIGVSHPVRQQGTYQGQYSDPFNPGVVSFSAPYNYLVQPWSVSAQALYHATPEWGFGISYMRLGLGGPIKNEAWTIASGPIPMRVRSNESIKDDGTILALARYVLSPERNWSAYAVGGLGVKLTSISGSFVADAPFIVACANPAQCLPISRDVSGRSMSPAAAIGFGVEDSLGESATAGAGITYYYVGSTTVGGILVHAENVIALHADIGFHLGGIGRK